MPQAKLKSFPGVVTLKGQAELPPEIAELICRTRAMSDDRILRLPEVRIKTGRAAATIWKDVSDGAFPPPVRIGPRAVGWRNSELMAWVEAWSLLSRGYQAFDMKEFIEQLTAPKSS